MPAADDKKAVFMFSNTECAEWIRITNKYIFLLLLYRKQKYAIKKQRWVTRSAHQSADRTYKYITMDVMPVKPKILRPFAYAKEKEKPAYS